MLLFVQVPDAREKLPVGFGAAVVVVVGGAVVVVVGGAVVVVVVAAGGAVVVVELVATGALVVVVVGSRSPLVQDAGWGRWETQPAVLDVWLEAPRSAS